MLTTALVVVQLTGTFIQCPNAPNIYGTARGCETVTSSEAPQPTCPDGYELVADGLMRPKCAKELIDPTFR